MIIGNAHSQASIPQLAQDDFICATQHLPYIRRPPPERFHTPHDPTGADSVGLNEYLNKELSLGPVVVLRDKRGGPCRIRAAVHDLNKRGRNNEHAR